MDIDSLVILDKKAFVYQIDIGPYFYVGCSRITSKKRLYDHKKFLEEDKHKNLLLQDAFNRIGSISFSILSQVDPEFIFEEEKFFIDKNYLSWNCVNQVRGSRKRK